MKSIQTRLCKYPLSPFFVLTFLLSWGLWCIPILKGQANLFLLIADIFGLTLSALLITALLEGKLDFQKLVKRMLIW